MKYCITFVLNDFFVSEFETQIVIQQGQIYEAKLSTPHCPGNAGCRAVITQTEGNNEFFLNDDFTLTFQVCHFIKLS